MNKKNLFVFIFIVTLSMSLVSKGKVTKKKDDPYRSVASGLKFRSIGPAFTSGRIADIAVNPNDHSEYYVAVASGNIWKTTNNGITFKPIFEKYGSYSIGCLAINPKNPKEVWAGTGENNHQRALGYGDGIYKTVNGGKNWKNMGLKDSRHIGKILINPKDTNIVYVAAEGSAWGPGGDRGLYRTKDGGKNWKKILEVSDHTGINELVMDPTNPDVIIAASEQRRRHVHTKIGGGPETALYKTTDGGKNWRKIMSGMPGVDKGGIGIAMSPVDPMVVYAMFEAADGKGGFYRSEDQGESWSKMSSHSSSAQYYSEIFCDPKDIDKVYSVETVSQYTEDAGKTWKRIGLKNRHVDDHALWIDPDDTRHLIIGGDGGIYVTWDSGKAWYHVSNLPVIQFYRVFVDNSKPFYYVYGGTQDNASMGGPSQNINSGGVSQGEWFITNFGDGFWSAVDPTDPNIVYAEAQYGVMVRYDRKSGEKKYIRPVPRKGEETYKWNWNTPLIISPHSNTRIYCAANKVFRSDDRGDSWKVISNDLTSKTDRNKWPVMGKYWSADAVAKDVSTSQFGTIVSLSESTVKENLIYAGTDDGVLQVTDNAGESWRKTDTFPGIPKYTYISDIMPSLYEENTVYVTFDNRKRDDFKPYILKSMDKGKTWKSISSNLPENGTVHTIAQDHIKKGILFAGTEFGVFFSINGGEKWTQLKSGIPTIAVRDIAVQREKSDLALATFGRGFYILDDYSPLRELNPELLKKEAHIFGIRDSLLYIRTGRKYGQGATPWFAKNPPYGAVFSYYLKDSYSSKRSERKKKEKELFKKGSPIYNPTWDELKEESKEISPYLVFTITDKAGETIKKLYKKPSKGINRMTWNLTQAWSDPVTPDKGKFNPLKKVREGFPVMPGIYNVSLSKVVNGVETKLAGPVRFKAEVLNIASLPAKDRTALDKFLKKITGLSRVIQGNYRAALELQKKVNQIRQTLHSTLNASPELRKKADLLEKDIDKIVFTFKGHKARASREEIPPSDVSIFSRLNSVMYAQYSTTSAPGKAQLDSLNIIVDEMKLIIKKLKDLKLKMKTLDKEMEKINAPWTSGRILELN
ncbi:MAG: glycosyl hydrolase [Acidobacteriota bacterium]